MISKKTDLARNEEKLKRWKYLQGEASAIWLNFEPENWSHAGQILLYNSRTDQVKPSWRDGRFQVQFFQKRESRRDWDASSLRTDQTQLKQRSNWSHWKQGWAFAGEEEGKGYYWNGWCQRASCNWGPAQLYGLSPNHMWPHPMSNNHYPSSKTLF